MGPFLRSHLRVDSSAGADRASTTKSRARVVAFVRPRSRFAVGTLPVRAEERFERGGDCPAVPGRKLPQ
jgi:hypothetical protein